MELSEELRDMFKEVFNIGVGKAAASLSEMLSHSIAMGIPDLYFLNEESFDDYVSEKKDRYVCVVQRIHGDLEGMGSLSFPLHNGKTLVDNMLNVTSSRREFGVMEIEAIQEVGNIIINAIGSAFGNVIGLRIEYEVPEVLLLDHPIPIDHRENDKNCFYTFATTSLKVEGVNIEGILNMMFAYTNLEALENFLEGNRGLSLKFGELLLEGDYITGTQLEEALEIQEDSHKFIGELVLERGLISVEDRDNILQSPEYLTYSKKFGEMLLEGNYLNPRQLNEILEVQAQSRSFLGEILVGLGYISSDVQERVASVQSVQK